MTILAIDTLHSGREDGGMDQSQPAPKKYRVTVVDSAGHSEVIVRDADRETAEKMKASLSQRFPQIAVEEQSGGENAILHE